jgi:hypothetical protein
VIADLTDAGRLPLFLCFLAFVVTFLTTRLITRMIRADRGPFKDNVSAGGTHIHHAVPGIILLISGAFISVAASTDGGWAIAGAILVGIGSSLVLDEFALILHLQDVYWSNEGRISVEMVSLAVAVLGLVLIGIDPFRADTAVDGSTRLATFLLLGVTVPAIAVCVDKGKFKLALFGAFIPFIAVLGAFRLARPGSRWARRYSTAKAARASRRTARYDARFGPATDWVLDFVAGRPSRPDPPAPGAPAAPSTTPTASGAAPGTGGSP